MAYFTTKFIAKYQNNALNNKSDIRVVESYRLANNKFIAIVKIGDSYYAIGLGKDEITLIDKLNSDEIKFDKMDETSEVKKLDFKEILSQIKKKESKDNDEK
ncbi:MAG: flagellar biosynthetic protein FliO [Wujia sp.]